LSAVARFGMPSGWSPSWRRRNSLNGSRRAFEDGLQALLSFEKRQSGQLFAIEKQKIEHEAYKVDRPSLVGRGLHLGKGCGAI
jgi:hypothetical protein